MSKIKVNEIEKASGSGITVPTGTSFTVVDGVAVAGGGTGLTSFTAGDLLYATGSTTLAKLPKGTANQELRINSGATAPEWYTPSAGGITEADQWRHTTSLNVTSEANLTSWERPDDQESSINCFAKIGTGMSHSSGTFTFPSTGIWLVRFVLKSQTGAEAANYGRIYLSKDGSNYDKIASGDLYISNGFNNVTVCEYLCDITNTSNDLMQFRMQSSSGTGVALGNTDFNQTSVTFIRLGDT